MKQAIILCSGGMDSVVTSNYVRKKLKNKYGRIIVLFFDYGQRTLLWERKASKKCALDIHAEFKEIKLNELKKISTSLINSNKKARKVSRNELKDTKEESLKYYVPARNTMFLIYALAIAESDFVKFKRKSDIFVGFKNEGRESYPDTTQKFVNQINKLQKQAVIGTFKIIAPLIKKDKEDIVKLGEKLNVRLENTYSCYVGSKDAHCGYCLSCRLRQEGFYWSGIKDKTKYKIKMKGVKDVCH